MSKQKSLYGERKPLHRLLPLLQPLAVYISTNNTCNFACRFCYHSKINKTGSGFNMSKAFFSKLISDLAEFDEPINTLYIGEYAEPLLHPLFSEFIRIAKENKVAKTIKMSTNASLLSKELSQKIVSAGMDFIQVSINGMSNEQYKEVVNRNIDFTEIRKNVENLYSVKGKTHIHVKCIGDYFTKEQRDEFINVFSPICDTIYVENVANQWLDMEIQTRNDTNRFGIKNSETSLICSRPFYMMAVHYNGLVIACPVNYKFTFSLGDANIDSLRNIWNSKAYKDLRMSVLHGDFREKYVDCSKCNFTEFQSSEDLTPYRDELIKKYERIENL